MVAKNGDEVREGTDVIQLGGVDQTHEKVRDPSTVERSKKRASFLSEVLLSRRRQQIIELAELRNGNSYIPDFRIVEGLLSALAV